MANGSIDGQSMSAPRDSIRSRSFRGGDIREAALEGLSALSVRLLPQRHWAAAGDFQANFFPNKSAGRIERFRRAVRAVLGEAHERWAVDLRRQVEMQEERRRLYVAALRAGPWSPSIEMIGLEEALRLRGTGIIFWFDFFAHYSIIGKMALANAGLAAWQLTSHEHGNSATRFGVRFINPRQIEVENRYIRGRVAFDDRTVVTATRRLLEILADGGIAAVTNNASLGHAAAVPFGETARLRIATTPLKLALRGNAAVFPVTVIETEPLRRYRVTIGSALAAPPAEAGDPIAAMLAAYADHLLPLVRAHPEQWSAWRGIA
jgi:hypothetical protein